MILVRDFIQHQKLFKYLLNNGDSTMSQVSNNNEGSSDFASCMLQALDLAGKESSKVILSYIENRYGIERDSVAEHKDEFYNYLRETLDSSAEIIISKINQALEQKGVQQSKRISSDVCFLICNSCFWCASQLFAQLKPTCPSCGHGISESIPILVNELYKFDCHPKHGVMLEFKRDIVAE